MPIVEEPLLDDIDVGDLEGQTVEDYRTWKRAHTRADPFPGGESLDDAARRYARGLGRLLELPHDRVLVVCHEIPVRYALNAAGGSERARRPCTTSATPYPTSSTRTHCVGRPSGIERLAGAHDVVADPPDLTRYRRLTSQQEAHRRESARGGRALHVTGLRLRWIDAKRADSLASCAVLAFLLAPQAVGRPAVAKLLLGVSGDPGALPGADRAGLGRAQLLPRLAAGADVGDDVPEDAWPDGARSRCSTSARRGGTSGTRSRRARSRAEPVTAT